MTPILLRIFIYGLVGFAPNPTGDVLEALFPDGSATEHISFVAFEKGECPSTTCPGITLNGPVPQPTIQGFKLSKQQLALSVAGANLTGSPALASNGVASFGAVPRISAILGSGGNVAPACVADDPAGCPAPLAMRLSLTGGSMETCHLVEHYDKGNPATPVVHRFAFQPQIGAQQVQQTLADVALYQATLAAGSKVQLTMTGFAKGSQPLAVPLTPQPCFDDKAKMCVDIFVGNIPPVLKEPDPRDYSDHFAMFYQLLAAPPSNGPIPFRDTFLRTASSAAQPACRKVFTMVPTILPQFAPPAAKKLAKKQPPPTPVFDTLTSGVGTPDNRPICPMVLYGKP